MSGENFISRWSRKKGEARDEGARQEAREIAPRQLPPVPAEPAPLPPIESLTPESDFSAFMREGVDPDLRRLAVKKLFEDPRFNVMDGLDVYIDDYSKPDPLPEGWLEKMNQVARLGIFQPPDPEKEEPAVAAQGNETPSLPPPEEAAPDPSPAVTSNDPIDVSQVGQSPPGTV